MTVCTSIIKKLFSPRSQAKSVVTDGMPAMALQTEKRHGGVEEMVVNRTVRRVAGGTILGHIAVLEGERPLLLHVATGTELFGGVSLEEMGLH